MNPLAIGKYIIVLEEKKEEKTASGLIVPIAASQEPEPRGHIVSVPEFYCNELKAGDYIIWEKHAGVGVKVGEKNYKAVKHEHIICKLIGA